MRKLTHTQILNIARGGLGFTHHKYKYSQEYLKPILKRMVKDGLIKQVRQDKTTVTYHARYVSGVIAEIENTLPRELI